MFLTLTAPVKPAPQSEELVNVAEQPLPPSPGCLADLTDQLDQGAKGEMASEMVLMAKVSKCPAVAEVSVHKGKVTEDAAFLVRMRRRTGSRHERDPVGMSS